MKANLEFTSRCQHQTTVGDAFKIMEDLSSRSQGFDVIVVDPPSFASKRKDKESAVRAYQRLTDLAFANLKPGGRLFQASCSSQVTTEDLVRSIEAVARRQDLALNDQRSFGHGVDHPVTFAQGQYLSAFTATVGVHGQKGSRKRF